jgi:hypothetical protein
MGRGGKEGRNATALAQAKATFEQRQRRREIPLAQGQDASTVTRHSQAEGLGDCFSHTHRLCYVYPALGEGPEFHQAQA